MGEIQLTKEAIFYSLHETGSAIPDSEDAFLLDRAVQGRPRQRTVDRLGPEALAYWQRVNELDASTSEDGEHTAKARRTITKAKSLLSRAHGQLIRGHSEPDQPFTMGRLRGVAGAASTLGFEALSAVFGPVHPALRESEPVEPTVPLEEIPNEYAPYLAASAQSIHETL